jgi:hypothetical protein
MTAPAIVLNAVTRIAPYFRINGDVPAVYAPQQNAALIIIKSPGHVPQRISPPNQTAR